jgi:hypothetical protein
MMMMMMTCVLSARERGGCLYVSWHSAVDMTTDMTTSSIEKTREGDNSVDGNCVREATAHQRKDYFVRMYSYTLMSFVSLHSHNISIPQNFFPRLNAKAERVRMCVCMCYLGKRANNVNVPYLPFLNPFHTNSKAE